LNIDSNPASPVLNDDENYDAATTQQETPDLTRKRSRSEAELLVYEQHKYASVLDSKQSATSRIEKFQELLHLMQHKVELETKLAETNAQVIALKNDLSVLQDLLQHYHGIYNKIQDIKIATRYIQDLQAIAKNRVQVHLQSKFKNNEPIDSIPQLCQSFGLTVTDLLNNGNQAFQTIKRQVYKKDHPDRNNGNPNDKVIELQHLETILEADNQLQYSSVLTMLDTPMETLPIQDVEAHARKMCEHVNSQVTKLNETIAQLELSIEKQEAELQMLAHV
jgi:hypothetical protein